MFGAEAESYVNDLKDIADFYGLYTDLMAHWSAVCPGGFYDLDYERLTENQEAETRALLEFVGLDWEDQCMEFHKTERVVATASAAQVREAMYTGSSDAWRRFEPFLGEFIGRLEGH